MVKIKNEFFESGAVEELKKLTDKELKATVAYSLIKVIKKINELGTIYMETKQKLLEKHGTLSEDKKQYSFENEKAAEFQKELVELLAIENDFEFTKVVLPGDIELSTKALMLLEDFITIK